MLASQSSSTGGTPVPVTLLVSATIRAKSDLPQASSLLLDSGTRAAIYTRNLRYWLRVLPADWGIAFVENSAAPVDSLLIETRDADCPRRVEIVSFEGNDFPGAFGKGYGEALLLDHAFATSTLIRGSALVAKVTGLQTVANLERLASALPQSSRWVADLRHHPVYRRLGSSPSGAWCDTRLFFATPGFYAEHLQGAQLGHREGQFFLETAYYSKMRSLLGSPGVHPRFPIEPAYRGPAGHWGKDYGSLRQRTKQLIRSCVRQLAPKLWV